MWDFLIWIFFWFLSSQCLFSISLFYVPNTAIYSYNVFPTIIILKSLNLLCHWRSEGTIILLKFWCETNSKCEAQCPHFISFTWDNIYSQETVTGQTCTCLFYSKICLHLSVIWYYIRIRFHTDSSLKVNGICYIESWPWRLAERTCNAERMDDKTADGVQFI